MDGKQTFLFKKQTVQRTTCCVSRFTRNINKNLVPTMGKIVVLEITGKFHIMNFLFKL